MPASARSGWNMLLQFLTLSVLLGGAVVSTFPAFFPSARDQSIEALIKILRARDIRGLQMGQEHILRFPTDTLGLALYAEIAASHSEHELAISLLEKLPQDGGRWEFRSRVAIARRLEIQGKLTLAEDHLRRALQIDPYHILAHDRLGYLQQVQGRTWESAPHFFMQIQRGNCGGDELIAMATTERFFWYDERLDRLCSAPNAPDHMLKLAQARQAIFTNRASDAERLLRHILSLRPELGEAQGRMGRIIIDRNDPAEFLRWIAQIPEEARNHPEVWFVQGVYARRLGQLEGAVNCFLKTLKLSPNHLGANVQISSCLEQLGEKAAAKDFARRGQILAELESTLNLLRDNTDVDLFFKTISLMSKLGRYWEAAGWCHVMRHLKLKDESRRYTIRRELRTWLSRALAEPGPNAPSMLPVRLLKKTEFTPPRWPVPEGFTQQGPQTAPATEELATQWAFTDQAEQLGIRFQYYEGTTEEQRMKHIFNTMGGGLGAVDFDLDGWPDLYLVQANNWRDPAPQPEHLDRLYRNEQGVTFRDITGAAGLHEDSFSHGVTVGDYDQDGFPDIYIGNKGANRLYHNNGDGTYTDVSESSGTSGDQWTTSSMFADLSGDGLPDLYVLNYTLMKETIEKECFAPNGDRMACSPDQLISDSDRLYLNLGDGRFEDVSRAAGIDTMDGKGLGIIGWDFAGDGRLGVFVANDTSPNFLFINNGLSESGVPQFHDDALVRGIALDSDGNALASMGVAAGDPTGDGRLDLFITTFFGESKVLFSQRQDRYFEDMTRPLNLRESGFWMLGFGCQFGDFDGDGWEDLIATNGHVDQSSVKGDPDRMPPQLFQNLRGKRFVEVPRQKLGKFFLGRYLGRGLATLDWNRDGATDVAISHIHSPVALLTNQTEPRNQPLVVKLVGRSGSREPTGAVVEVLASESTRSSQKVGPTRPGMTRLQTAGDGFLVTNERRLHFAVPRDESDVEIKVRWPGGKVQHMQKVAVGQEILIVEDQPAPYSLRKFGSDVNRN